MDDIAPGTTGWTRGALRPYGQVEVEGTIYEARVQHGWLDQDVEVG